MQGGSTRLNVQLGGPRRQDVRDERRGVQVQQDGGAFAQRPQLGFGVGAAAAEEAHHARRARRLRRAQHVRRRRPWRLQSGW